MAVRDLVVSVGSSLGRSSRDVQPFVRTLEENWYDSVESLSEATPDDLTALGLPRRFAVELTAAAAADARRGGGKAGSFSSKGKGKSKGKDDFYDDDRGKGKGKNKGKDSFDDKGKGKSKGKDFFDDKGKGKGKSKSKGKGKSRGELSHRIPIDLDGVTTDFRFRPRILGNKGANLFHIQDQTGISVELQGQDEDGSMELVLTGTDEEQMDRAAQLCEDLVGSVFDEFEETQGGGKSKGKGKKGDKGKGKGKDKGKDKGKSKSRAKGEHEVRIPISTEEGIDHLRAKLVGEGGRNVKHVQKATGAFVSVEHDDGDGMAFTISAEEESALESAREMCEDLLRTVLEEAGISKKRARTTPEGSSGSKKGSGKGKRKSKDKDDGEERPRKAQKTDD